MERYVSALIRELELRHDELPEVPETIFFGGGTPTLLTLRQWERILTTFDRFGWLGAAEWTVESNPATVSADEARLLREAGVNRISMGVQSLDEALLDRLGRVHQPRHRFPLVRDPALRGFRECEPGPDRFGSKIWLVAKNDIYTQ